MNRSQRQLALKLAKSILPEDEYERMLHIPVKDEGYGFDPFGMEKESAILTYAFARFLYKDWFRVESEGHEHVPQKGRAMIVANHSGVIPIDGAMIAVDIAHQLEQPRVVRSMVDNFMGFLPFLNVFFYRVGQVVGARRNFEDLLRNDEIISVFPEGTKGLGKPYSRKYKLARFNVGFIELSLRFKTPIIPCAVIGAEEQAPMIANIKPIARLLNFPYFPVTPLFPALGPLGMLPLPVKYRIVYGKPIRIYEELSVETVDEPEVIRHLAEKVQMTVQEMIDDELAKRESVFGFAPSADRRSNGRRRKRREI